MKQVTIIYRNCNNPNAINFIKNNLEEVLESISRSATATYADVKPEEKLKADAFLALGEDIFQRVKESGYVDDFSKIIKMNRSPDRIALNKISEIPLNTNVLIVNDSYESSLDTTYSFYEAASGISI